MSIYTPAPPDQYAVIEGVEHFHKLHPADLPAYADVYAWSRRLSESSSSDPRFLEADITALADAINLALEHVHQKALAKYLRSSRLRYGRRTPPAPTAGVQ